MRRPDPGGGRRLRPQLRHQRRPVRQGHPYDRRGRRRRPHPDAAADAVLPLHAAHDRRGPGLRRGPAAAPGGDHQRRPEGQRNGLHLLRGGAARPAGPARQGGQAYKEPIQRYKGLGEMDADQLAETTMDPRHRTLRKVGIENAKQAEETFDLLMGSDVAPRKDFIIAGASSLDRERIDA